MLIISSGTITSGIGLLLPVRTFSRFWVQACTWAGGELCRRVLEGGGGTETHLKSSGFTYYTLLREFTICNSAQRILQELGYFQRCHFICCFFIIS